MKNKILIFLLLLTFNSFSQEIPLNKYGLPVVEDINIYFELTEIDSNNILVDLEEYIPGIILDIKYAGTDNFAGIKFYDYGKAYLRLPAAKSLKLIQEELNKVGLGIKIFDAYRPYDITIKIWELVLDDNYAASPQTGSRHNRGCAVDLTLIDLETKEELEMPTIYDDFSETAHHDFMGLSEEKIANREFLKEIMEKHGFDKLQSEWWHYDFSGWKNYDLMNISFDKLEAIKK